MEARLQCHGVRRQKAGFRCFQSRRSSQEPRYWVVIELTREEQPVGEDKTARRS